LPKARDYLLRKTDVLIRGHATVKSLRVVQVSKSGKSLLAEVAEL
jgi:hypothetical protein